MLQIPSRIYNNLNSFKPVSIIAYVAMVKLLREGKQSLSLDRIGQEAGLTNRDVRVALNQLEISKIIIRPYVDGNRRSYVLVVPEI